MIAKNFCENCFDDENIKQFIRENGFKIETEFFCKNCGFETEVCEIDIDNCVQEYVDDCINKIQNEVSDMDFENNEDKYYEQCEIKCNDEYLKVCKNKYIKPTYIIEQQKLILKLKEVILNLYHYDNEDTYLYMTRDAERNYIENGDDIQSPEYYADSVSLNDLEGIPNKQEYYFSTLEEILEYEFNVDDPFNCIEIFNQYTCYKQNEVEWNIETKVWKDKCLYADEQYKITLWKEFKEYTKYKARFFTHKNDTYNISKELNKFNSLFQKLIVNLDDEIYRARIIDNKETLENIKKAPKRELGKAPKEIVKNNRFSPVGISYGYFAFDKDTALLEIEAKVKNDIAIGYFKLNKLLKLIDFSKYNFTKYSNPFSDNFNNDMYCEALLIKDFLNDISKPINGKEIEYIPTQILSEYIWSLGYDGFIYDSSKNENGRNILLFGDNPTYLKFIKVKVNKCQKI